MLSDPLRYVADFSCTRWIPASERALTVAPAT